MTSQASAAFQDPGDEHWVGELTVSGFDSYVTALVSDRQGNVYVGGAFTVFGGEPADHIAKWDGTSWSGLGDGPDYGQDEAVYNLDVDSRGYVYTNILMIPEVGLPENVIMLWDGSSWSPLGGDLSGLVDTLEGGRDSNIVINDMVVDSQDQLYAGGYFYLIQTERYFGYVARWDGSTWSALGAGMDDLVMDLVVDPQGYLVAAGWFRRTGDVESNGIARWDGSAWRALGDGTNIVEALAIGRDGNVYASGMFFIPPGSSTFMHYVARWDGATWSPLGEWGGQNCPRDGGRC